MNQLDINLILVALGQTNNDLCMIKAFNSVLLSRIASSDEDYQELIKEVESLHAQYLLDYQKIVDQIINKGNTSHPGDLGKFLK